MSSLLLGRSVSQLSKTYPQTRFLRRHRLPAPAVVQSCRRDCQGIRSLNSRAARNEITTTTKGGSEVTKTSLDGVIGRPINFDVASKIEGNESQVRAFRKMNSKQTDLKHLYAVRTHTDCHDFIRTWTSSTS